MASVLLFRTTWQTLSSISSPYTSERWISSPYTSEFFVSINFLNLWISPLCITRQAWRCLQLTQKSFMTLLDIFDIRKDPSALQFYIFYSRIVLTALSKKHYYVCYQSQRDINEEFFFEFSYSFNYLQWEYFLI